MLPMRKLAYMDRAAIMCNIDMIDVANRRCDREDDSSFDAVGLPDGRFHLGTRDPRDHG
jgi:hypothetical protein